MTRPFIGALAAWVALILLPVPLRSATGDAWVEVRTPHFVVISNTGEKAARRTAVQFENIRSLVEESLPVAASQPSPITTVLAFKDADSFRTLLSEYWQPGHAHPAGIFSHRLNQFYTAIDLDTANPNPTIYHECFHSISARYFPKLPAWLAEGLAVFYGTTQITDVEAGMGMPDEDLVRQLLRGPTIPLETLFQVDHASPFYTEENKTSVFYAESWAVTHYLMVGDNGAHRQLLLDYLAAMKRGETSLQAARETFGALEDLDGKVLEYIRTSPGLYLRSLPPPTVADSEVTASPISATKVAAYEGGFLAVEGQTESAIKLLREALAAEPELMLAQENLTLALFFAGKRAEGIESASNAIMLDPANATLRYVRAYLSFKGTMRQVNPQMESDLRAAVASDANFAAPHALLAAYLVAQGVDLPEAVEFAHKAITLEPANSMYQLVWAKVLGRLNRDAESHAAALRARDFATEPADHDAANLFLDYLDRKSALAAGVTSAAANARPQL